MNDLFLRACRNEKLERRPVWMMRQAGRYLPEYRKVRETANFLTMCKTPELAAEVTIQPLDLVGVDAAILFADILLILEAMGAELDFVEGKGPVFANPVRVVDDFSRLRRPDVDRDLGYVFDAIRLLRRELAGRVPLIGFAGTPWTVTSYLVEGGTSKSFAHLLGWSHRDPAGLGRLLDKVADASVDYLLGQIDAGAQAIQLFDTWGGLLDAKRWREIALPPVLKIIEALSGKVPLIFYLGNGAHLLPELARLPVEVLSVDWRVPLNEVRRIVGPRFVLQGNLDPTTLLGSEEAIEQGTRAMLAAAGDGGHIVNLGHGILPMTSPAKARHFVKTAQDLSAQKP